MNKAIVLLPLLLVRRNIFFDGLQTSEHGLYITTARLYVPDARPDLLFDVRGGACNGADPTTPSYHASG